MAARPRPFFVGRSARTAGEAAGQARGTTDRLGGLSKAATRIGKIVEPINITAGRTNLLALLRFLQTVRTD
ncbi:hypothetical protein [Bradyrhizobium sp. SZCCHNS3052]|uniref:hypothetical protein n=1 Tax=Bradyrhizobium TaxID=374 RepID=UPI00396711F2